VQVLGILCWAARRLALRDCLRGVFGHLAASPWPGSLSSMSGAPVHGLDHRVKRDCIPQPATAGARRLDVGVPAARARMCLTGESGPLTARIWAGEALRVNHHYVFNTINDRGQTGDQGQSLSARKEAHASTRALKQPHDHAHTRQRARTPHAPRRTMSRRIPRAQACRALGVEGRRGGRRARGGDGGGPGRWPGEAARGGGPGRPVTQSDLDPALTRTLFWRP
jgi:hypothetical protein